MTHNFNKVFRIFRDNYIEIPLEIFKDNLYKTLISTLLSSRTRDEVTLEASKRLFKKAPNIKDIRKLRLDEIKKLIYPVGFYNTKSKNLKNLADQVVGNFKGNIPSKWEDLIRLPGVGRKTANLVLNRALNHPAIAVDTHVHRISNLLGWVKTKTPEQTEKELVKILPKKYWSDTNRFFVSIGRTYRSKNKLLDFLKKEKLI